MEDKQISNSDSLRLIRQMISVAKDDRFEDGDGWLIWGWLLFLASISSIVADITGYRNIIGWIWLGMLGAGIVIYLLAHVMRKRAVKVKTYVQELIDKIEIGFFISLFTIVAGSMISGGLYVFGYYYILYAFLMFIHGSAIRFKPLMVGAFVNWAAAIAIFLVDNLVEDALRYVMAISALAILIGYLVPGYMLRSEYKRKLIQQQSAESL